ncbi:MAG: flagellar export protein FliJ [Bacillaceae bacterium]|nr:flagellar export protein FliJ [Bacillaceae bacterium]
MANIEAFEKILNMRDREKQEAERDFQQAVDHFESAATQLYHLLKEKEDIESQLNDQMQMAISASRITSYNLYLNQLQKKINEVQISVQQARHTMEMKQVKLTEAYIETKKFEKILEHKKTEFKEELMRQEKILMDDISVQQFIQKRNR